jgi:uncharacterized membrane protein
MRKSYLFSSVIFAGCATLALLAYKAKFIKIKNARLSGIATGTITVSGKQVCIDSIDRKNGNISQEQADEIAGCYDVDAIDATKNGTIVKVLLVNLKKIVEFLKQMEIGFIALIASCAGMALFKFGLAFYPKNLLLNTLYDIVHIAVITGGLVMILMLIFIPSYMKYKGLDNGQLKSENNIKTFDSFYLQYDSWDTGMIFICVVYGLLIVELLLNRTVKIFRKKK